MFLVQWGFFVREISKKKLSTGLKKKILWFSTRSRFPSDEYRWHSCVRCHTTFIIFLLTAICWRTSSKVFVNIYFLILWCIVHPLVSWIFRKCFIFFNAIEARNETAIKRKSHQFPLISTGFVKVTCLHKKKLLIQHF